MNNAGGGASDARRWRYGLIGCGRFGWFCLERLRGWPRARPVAAADAVASAAAAAAREFDLAACATPEELLARSDLDLVLISTPPHTHHPLALQALAAGKHVICEKPLALTLGQADEMIAAAAAAGRLLVVNHMLRYNPLLEIVRRIIASRALGAPLHFLFENYAEDERLPANHWFWDRRHSGGIFIEHAVHFFDLYRWWLGEGEVLAAHVERRPAGCQEDRAWCAVRHPGGVVGQQYHGFDQPVRLDRADHRIVLERGELVVRGWIPVELQVNGIVDEEQQARLVELGGDAELELIERYAGPQQLCRGRGHGYRVTARVSLRRRLGDDKGAIYGDMIRSFFADQLSALERPDHRPRLRVEDAREALRMAVAAAGMAGLAGGDDDAAR
jgi:predicted dehydrogenase